MSSDGYFDDSLDEAAFAQLDAIEAAYTSSSNGIQATTSKPASAISRPLPLKSVSKEDSFYDVTLDLDDEDFEKLDNIILDSYTGREKPLSGPTRQMTLFGDVLPNTTQGNKPPLRKASQRTASMPRNSSGSKPKKTKIWDQTAFAKSGQKKKAKGKLFEDEEEEEERVEFEQFPAPFVPPGKLPAQFESVNHTEHVAFPVR
jgi:ATP-dependent DNA helicase MPH1